MRANKFQNDIRSNEWILTGKELRQSLELYTPISRGSKLVTSLLCPARKIVEGSERCRWGSVSAQLVLSTVFWLSAYFSQSRSLIRRSQIIWFSKWRWMEGRDAKLGAKCPPLRRSIRLQYSQVQSCSGPLHIYWAQIDWALEHHCGQHGGVNRTEISIWHPRGCYVPGKIDVLLKRSVW